MIMVDILLLMGKKNQFFVGFDARFDKPNVVELLDEKNKRVNIASLENNYTIDKENFKRLKQALT